MGRWTFTQLSRPQFALRRQRSQVRILSGAPPSTHLRTRFGGLSGHDSSLKHVLTTHNPNTVIIDLDEVDEGLQIGLSERYRSVRELLPPPATEPVNERGIDADCGGNLNLGSLERSLCAVAIGLEVVESILEHVIEIGHAV